MRFTYTWKEIQARNGYILHGLHNDDIPVELVTTTSSQNGAVCSRAEGDSGDITENIWYTGSRDSGEIQAETAGRKVQTLKASGISTPSDTERLLHAFQRRTDLYFLQCLEAVFHAAGR